MRSAEQLQQEYALLAEDFERTNPYAGEASVHLELASQVLDDAGERLHLARAQVNASLAVAFEEFKSRRTRT